MICGIFQFELVLLLRALKPLGFSQGLLNVFVQPWIWPGYEKHPPRKVFSKKREPGNKTEAYRLGSGEAFAIYAVIRYFLSTAVPAGLLLLEKASWLALASVIDGFLALRMGLLDATGVDAWEVAVVNHLKSFKACLLYTSPSPRDRTRSRMPSSA